MNPEARAEIIRRYFVAYRFNRHSLTDHRLTAKLPNSIDLDLAGGNSSPVSTGLPRRVNRRPEIRSFPTALTEHRGSTGGQTHFLIIPTNPALFRLRWVARDSKNCRGTVRTKFGISLSSNASPVLADLSCAFAGMAGLARG